MKQCLILLLAAVFFSNNLTGQTIVPNGTIAPQLSLPLVPEAYGPSKKVNFVRTWEARRAVTDGSETSLNNNGNFKTATVYHDGLGRPIQTVIKGSNYDGTKDIVSINTYNEFGSETRQYLPYSTETGSNGKFRLNPYSEQQSYYNTNFQDQTPFNKVEYEASPISRLIKSFAPGNNWTGEGRGIENQFSVNTTSEDVRIATIGYTNNATPIFGSPYSAGDLIKTISTDEDGKKKIEYRNKQGQIILKKVQLADNPSAAYVGWVSTYYIYDDLLRLRYVIQPKGVDLLTISWQLSDEIKNELCFIYEYDLEGRMISKKTPGVDPVYTCYDKWDRPVFTQDGKMRNEGKWVVTWFDAFDRPTSTALYNVGQTHSQMQSYLDVLDAENPVPQFDEYYLTRLNFTYYDDYDMVNTMAYDQGIMDITYNNVTPGDELVENLLKCDLTRGMVTGFKTRILGTNDFLRSTTYYDTKARPIQTKSTNSKGGTDVFSIVFSFTGKIMSSYLVHNNPISSLQNAQTIHIYTRSSYSNDFLTRIEKKINPSLETPWQRIAEFEYDNMGRLKRKMMGNPASNFYVDMDYNIRGWLTGINKTAQQNLENGTIGANTFYSAIFSEILHYDYGFSTPAVGGTGGGYFNGNISGIKWANASDKQARSYGYEYDNINRLKKADFTQKAASLWNVSANIDYSLTNIAYDANGNILNLAQKALKLNSSSPVDDLTYNYQSNSNKLMRVTDALNDPATKLGDFKDGTNTSDDYSYDSNGSMIQDNNKTIGNITYNYLNLPQMITVPGKGTIEYTYDASGNKLQKKVTEGTKITTTDYLSGFVYNNNELQFTGHEEGRVRYAKKYFLSGDSAYTWQYDYFYKDHLGNIRAVVTEQKDTSKYMATFETANREKENALFANIEATAFDIDLINKPGLSGSCLECILPENGTSYPVDNTTNPNHYVSRLNGEGKRIGAAITLKVMAGDKIDLGVKVWYPESEISGLPEIGEPEDVLPSLINTLSGNTAGLSGGKASSTELSGAGSPLWAGIQSFLDSHPEDGSIAETPRAYLNWVLFDEQFKYVPDGSGFIRVPGFSNDIQTLVNSNIPVVKSGYLFVYLSNETQKRDVFFDNLVVQHYTGPLSETADYTAWGLDMKMLESKAFGKLDNRIRFNSGSELNSLWDINLYETNFRNYDPQIGRFMQVEPLADDYHTLSTYCFALNNPVFFNDPLGLDGTPTNDFKNIGEILNYLDRNGLEGFSNGFYRWAFGKNGETVSSVYDPNPHVGKNENGTLGLWVDYRPNGNDPNIAYHGSLFISIGKLLPRVSDFVDIFDSKRSSSNPCRFNFVAPLAGKLIEWGIREGIKFAVKAGVVAWVSSKAEDIWDRATRPIIPHFLYSLRAAKSGLYPVYTWGSKKPTAYIPLVQGEVWKYGTSWDPEVRYSAEKLASIGGGVYPVVEATGTKTYIYMLEKVYIVDYMDEYNRLPPGNKMIR